MPRKPETWVTKDFSGGLFTDLPPFLLGSNQSPVLENADPSSPAGISKKRKGRNQFGATQSTLTGDGSVSGLTIFRKDDGTVINVATEGTKIYKFDGSAWTEINQAGAADRPTANKDVWFAELKDTLVFTSEGMQPQKWDGVAANLSDLVITVPSGTPSPAGARYCVQHASSIWLASTSGEGSGLWKSAVGTVDAFNTAVDSFFARVAPGEGDRIRAFVPVGDVLIVAKQNRIYVVYGTTFDDFRIVPHRTAFRGPISDRGWTVHSGLFIYASADGIYAVGPNTFAELSVAIRPDYLAISDKTTISMGTYRDQIWVAFKDGASQNNAAFVLDIKKGVWSKFTSVVSRVFFRDIDGVLYSGLSTAGSTTKVWKHDDTTQDDGVSITYKMETPDVDFGDWRRDKQAPVFWIWAKPIAGGDLTIDFLADGAVVAAAQLVKTISAPAYNSSAQQVLIRARIPQAVRGRLLRIRIQNDDNAQSEIYGVAMEANLFEAVQTD